MNLTKRELEIADLMSWGCSAEEAAERLHISPSTVSNTLRKIYEKPRFNKISAGNNGNRNTIIILTHLFVYTDKQIKLRRTRPRRVEFQEHLNKNSHDPNPHRTPDPRPQQILNR